MKERIISLKFKNSVSKGKGQGADKLGYGINNNRFILFRNVNEGEDALDISIHDNDAKIQTEPKINPPRIDPNTIKRFKFQVNNTIIPNSEIDADSISQEDVIIKKKKDDVNVEAIYQFSIPFKYFAPNKDNVLTIDVLDTSPADLFLASFSLEFFTEVEDNFINVRLDRPGIEPRNDQILWSAIKKHSLKFSEYGKIIDDIICKGENVAGRPNFDRKLIKNRSPFIKTEEYNLIKFATEFYMLAKFGFREDELSGYVSSKTGKLPYYDLIIDRIKDDLKFESTTFNPQITDECDILEQERLFNPFMIELIWSYWMEQGMLVQTLNVINLRFQNIKGNKYVDPLLRFDVDPLRPLSHILWGYIQDEQHRLSIPRRLYEYQHEYGLTLTGSAIPRITPADSRVPFLEAFHSLLNQCTFFFHEANDTTRIADAFPILNSLKEVHLLLAEGNHNAYGNLTWTARHEMLMQQYILSRSEMREFMGGKVMVPYPETWMDRVDTMRNIQGWGGTSIVYYYELAVHGELILLSIRYGNWSDVQLDSHSAANWALEFRNSIQRYVYAYRTVTGVDLSSERMQLTDNNFATQPAFLIQQRMAPSSNGIGQRKLPSPLFRM